MKRTWMSTRVADGRFEFVDSQQILNRNSRDMQFTILSEMQVAVCTPNARWSSESSFTSKNSSFSGFSLIGPENVGTG